MARCGAVRYSRNRSYFKNRSGTGRVAKGVADGLWRRAQQLKLRVEKLQDYLRPIERTTLHHPGDALAHKKLEQQDPQLVAGHAQAVKAKALEGIRKQRAKEKELGRDDRGRGR